MTTTQADPETFFTEEDPDAPVACDMTGASDTADERLAEYGRLFVHALVGRERTRDGVQYRFAAKPGVAAWAADLARREALCCPSLSYRVRREGDTVLYDIGWKAARQIGAAAEVMLDELHAMPDRFADGMTGFMARLAARGVPLDAPSARRFVLRDQWPTPATPSEPGALGLASQIPIACIPAVFTREERAAHLELSFDAIVRWPLRRQELPDGHLFEYEGNEERFLALARWAAGEHRCCPWASYSVEMAPFAGPKPGTLRVRVRATDEGTAFLRTCYEYVEKLQGARPPDSLFQAERITPDDVRREMERCAGC
jgi:hypothetical protein